MAKSTFVQTAFKVASDIAKSDQFLEIATHPEYSDQQRREKAQELVTEVIAAKYPEYAAVAGLVIPIVVEGIRHEAQRLQKKKDQPAGKKDSQ